MMRYFCLFALLSLISCQQNPERARVLFIASSVGEFNNAPNGTYLIELAVPFDLFNQKDFEIDIVSPQGGEIPIYHSGDTTSAIKQIIESATFQYAIRNSLNPRQAMSDSYDAVLIPGGYGQFLDTHQSTEIQQIIASIYESGGVIGSLGHGTATLINVKLSSGEFLVKGKTLTSFPSWNERNVMQQSDYGRLLPYDMEVELKARGANLKIYDHEKKINFEIVDTDNRLVTASFAGSGAFIANEVIHMIEAK